MAVPAQAFLHGGVAPIRAGALASRSLTSSPLQARSMPLTLPRRRATVQMSAAVTTSPAKSVVQKIGKVAVAMMTIFFLMLGAPMDADAASRSKGRSGGRIGGGFRANPPAQSKTLPASTTSTSTAPAGAVGATATAGAPAAATAAAAAPTTVVHHHHHGGGGVGGGGLRMGLGLGIGAGLASFSPFGFSPFGGFGMPFGGFGMGYRPFMPLTSIITAVFLIGAVSMAWVFFAASGSGRRGRK